MDADTDIRSLPRDDTWRYFLRIFLPAVTLILTAAVALWLWEKRHIEQQVLASEPAHLRAASQQVGTKLAEAASDLRVLGALPALMDYLDQDSEANRLLLNDHFQQFLRYKAELAQLRYLDEAGRERVRLNRNGNRIEPVPAASLQHKAGRYYVQQALRLAPGRIYLSPFDLNVEHGQIERPFRPMLRLALHIADRRGAARGLVVINLLGEGLRGRIDDALQTAAGQGMLLNQDGYWLLAPLSADEWGGQLGTGRRIQADYPDLWPRLDQPAGQLWQDGALYSYRRIDPVEIIAGAQSMPVPEHAHGETWLLMTRVAPERFAVLLQPTQGRLALLAFVLLLVAGVTAAWIARNQVARQRLREAVEASLAASQQQQRLLALFIERVPAAVAMLDNAMRYIAVSRRWYTDYHLDGDIIGRSHYEVFPEIPDRWKAIHRHCLAGNAESCDEDPFPREDGSMEWLQWEVSPWYGSDGKVGGIIMFTEVITERKRIAELKDEFVAKVSHELRTPLTAIQAAIRLLQGGVGGELVGQGRELVDLAERNGQRLLGLVNDLLDLQKLQLGRLHLLRKPLEVGKTVANVIAVNRTLTDERRLTVKLQSEVGDLEVLADEARLAQVLTNLLANAVKFSPVAGEVEVLVQRRGMNVHIAVSDHGPGVPESFRPRIFQPFSQADDGNTRHQGGSGLGLVIARSMVESHGGKLDYVNRQEGGATFFFDLPLQ